MIRILAVISVIALALLNIGKAEAKFEAAMLDERVYSSPEKEVGRFAYQWSVRGYIEASPYIDAGDKSELIILIEQSSVTSEKYLKVVDGSGLPEVEKQRLRQLANGRGFLFLAHLEEGHVPAGIISLLGLKKNYEYDEVRNEEICKGMPFTVNGAHGVEERSLRGVSASGDHLQDRQGQSQGRAEVQQRVPTCRKRDGEDVRATGSNMAKHLEQGVVWPMPGCPDGGQLHANVWSKASLRFWLCRRWPTS